MTNHAIIALERVRDELSDDRRGLPRVTRSYQRPAPRSVTPHHSRRHAARLLGANRNQRNSSTPSLSSPRPEELAQTKSKSKFFAYTVSKSWKHGVRAPQQGASGLLVRGRGSDRAAARATRTRAAVASPAIMWRKVLVGSLAMASGAAAFAPAAAPALSRAHSGPLLSSCTSPSFASRAAAAHGDLAGNSR